MADLVELYERGTDGDGAARSVLDAYHPDLPCLLPYGASAELARVSIEAGIAQCTAAITLKERIDRMATVAHRDPSLAAAYCAAQALCCVGTWNHAEAVAWAARAHAAALACRL